MHETQTGTFYVPYQCEWEMGNGRMKNVSPGVFKSYVGRCVRRATVWGVVRCILNVVDEEASNHGKQNTFMP
jgi:hypothetical protein